MRMTLRQWHALRLPFRTPPAVTPPKKTAPKVALFSEFAITLPDHLLPVLIQAPTRSEARARLKAELGLARIPAGTLINRV